ncbi:MAG: ribbon-helix-helix protein, CopG family [Chloroflexi bacterium]|nr:ribbon-helix-helix protein, CopG family [Chloroflexota bacterium]
MVALSLPDELEEQLVELATKQGRSLEALTAQALRDYLARRAVPRSAAGKISPYARFKNRLRRRYPELAHMAPGEASRRLEELSARIRKNLQFATPEEAQAFMRGTDRYDFERQQYLHH